MRLTVNHDYLNADKKQNDMGYKRSMFPKSSSRLGLNILSGIIIGGTAATAYGIKKVADKIADATNNPKNKQLAAEGEGEVGIAFKIFVYVFLLTWICFGFWLGSVTFVIIAIIVSYFPLFHTIKLIKEDFTRKKKKRANSTPNQDKK